MRMTSVLSGALALAMMPVAHLAAQEDPAASPGTAADAVDVAPEPELTPEEQAAADEMIEKGEITVERKICRVITKTGSIMPKKVCRTLAEEEYDNEVASEYMRIMNARLESERFQRMLRDGGPS